jgi:hypothetical protein
VTGQSPVVNHVLWPLQVSSWRKDSERFHHKVLEDSIRGGSNILKGRYRLLSLVLLFLKIVVNSMLA